MEFTSKHNQQAGSSAIGIKAEQIAYDYLLLKGLTPVERNFSTRRGEIDIIMNDGKQLVFVEVRYRQSTLFGGAEESVTAKKFQRLKAAASAYMQTHRLTNNTAARFDVIALTGDLSRRELYSVNWIENILVA
ncbi:MAG: putative endonuclease [Neolewinella sp.]|jgi:putative endonuclease